MSGDDLKRAIDAYIAEQPLKDGGTIVLTAARAFLAKRSGFSIGSSLTCLQLVDQSLTVSIAGDEVAPKLWNVHHALQAAIGGMS